MQTTSKPLVERFFTVNNPAPLKSVNWVKREARIEEYGTGKVIFEQKDVEFPDFWSQRSIDVTVSKYFKGPLGTERRETSLKQVIRRVVNQITKWGCKDGYFEEGVQADVFGGELEYLLVNQMAAFNSPVWFNCGVKDESSSGWCWDATPTWKENLGINELDAKARRVQPGEHKPQCSACFITGPEDNMESILDWVKTEGLIFKYGSGSGANVSSLRSSKESLSSGGVPSGPLEFMKIADQAAGSIKSGGKHRRAAKMVILNAEHPDILDFIRCKSAEERKARKLIEAGFSAEFNADGGAYASVFYQNANHSVRATDEFMKAAVLPDKYWTRRITDGKPCELLDADTVLTEIAKATHECGDPGMQFDTTCNKWHTCKTSGRIDASNPCSEYMFLKDTACNLASLNLMKFRDTDGSFRVADFTYAVNVMLVAMDILVDNASYPTKEMAENSHRFRTLGLGYANLGSYLMSVGLPYAGRKGQDFAAAITSLMTSQAYTTSAMLADRLSPFEGYNDNAVSMNAVIGMHMAANANACDKNQEKLATDVFTSAAGNWARLHRSECVYRNAQVTVLAPTGTIGFMMDCDTTGIEPELGLVKYKKLVGGGTMKVENTTVALALEHLGFNTGESKIILDYINKHGAVEGCSLIPDRETLEVFDTSFPAEEYSRSIPWQAHIEMMAAVQPFLSGAISKTVNMPEDATVEDIKKAYIRAWELGLKSVAIYRNNCKQSQPLNTKAEAKVATVENVKDVYSEGLTVGMEMGRKLAGRDQLLALLAKANEDDRRAIYNATVKEFGGPGVHRKLVGTRKAIVHEFLLNGHKGYLTVGLYPDGTPGEIFVDVSKEGSTVSGLMDALAISTSFNLQHGVPLRKLVDKFSFMKFEPAGWTTELGFSHSLVDYIFRWLGKEFLGDESKSNEPVPEEKKQIPLELKPGLEGVQKLHPAFEELGGSEKKLTTIQTGRFESYLTQMPRPDPRFTADAPTCTTCGNPMVRNGSCYKCETCGSTSGCS